MFSFDRNSQLPQTYRESGLVVHLDVKFTNENQFSTTDAHYFLLVPSVEVNSSFSKMHFGWVGGGGGGGGDAFS